MFLNWLYIFFSQYVSILNSFCQSLPDFENNINPYSLRKANEVTKVVEASGLNAWYKKALLSVLDISNKAFVRTMPKEKAQRLKVDYK